MMVDAEEEVTEVDGVVAADTVVDIEVGEEATVEGVEEVDTIRITKLQPGNWGER